MLKIMNDAHKNIHLSDISGYVPPQMTKAEKFFGAGREPLGKFLGHHMVASMPACDSMDLQRRR
jgi:hypothetical protein